MARSYCDPTPLPFHDWHSPKQKADLVKAVLPWRSALGLPPKRGTSPNWMVLRPYKRLMGSEKEKLKEFLRANPPLALGHKLKEWFGRIIGQGDVEALDAWLPVRLSRPSDRPPRTSPFATAAPRICFAYFHFYNTQRPHQALGYRTPAEVFNGDSVETMGHMKERRWSPTEALADLGKTAGLSLNFAPTLSN